MSLSSPIVSIKGTRNGLVIILDSGSSFEELKASLTARMQSAGAFFQGATYRLRCEKVGLTLAQQEELEDICLQHGLEKKGDAGDPVATIYVTDRAVVCSSQPLNPGKGSCKFPGHAPQLIGSEFGNRNAEGPQVYALKQANAAEKNPPPGPPVAEEGEDCLLHRGPVRSGQLVKSSFHLAVIGDVHPGAELIAAGSILVLGDVRGYVAAGTDRNVTAVIVADKFIGCRLSICGVTAEVPAARHPGSVSRPVIAQLTGSNITVEPYLYPM